MTRAVYAIARWVLWQLPVDAAGRRVFDETLADWRKERGALRGVCAVIRSVLMVSGRELTSGEGANGFRRLSSWSMACLIVALAFNWNQSVLVDGSPVSVGPTVIALGSLAWVVSLLPLIAFVSMTWGHRLARPAPRLGSALALGLVMMGVMGWGLPAAFQSYRELVFALTSGLAAPVAGTPAPGWNERSLVELFILVGDGWSGALSALNLRLFFIVAVPVMLILGATARSMAGKWRLAATAFPLVTFGMPFLARVGAAYVTPALWGSLLVATLVVGVLAEKDHANRADDPGHEGPMTLPPAGR
jgi:hypothetical protein